MIVDAVVLMVLLVKKKRQPQDDCTGRGDALVVFQLLFSVSVLVCVRGGCCYECEYEVMMMRG